MTEKRFLDAHGGAWPVTVRDSQLQGGPVGCRSTCLTNPRTVAAMAAAVGLR